MQHPHTVGPKAPIDGLGAWEISTMRRCCRAKPSFRRASFMLPIVNRSSRTMLRRTDVVLADFGVNAARFLRQPFSRISMEDEVWRCFERLVQVMIVVGFSTLLQLFLSEVIRATLSRHTRRDLWRYDQTLTHAVRRRQTTDQLNAMRGLSNSKGDTACSAMVK